MPESQPYDYPALQIANSTTRDKQAQESLAISDAVPQAPSYALPGKYRTELAPNEEQAFMQWLQRNQISKDTFDPTLPVTDYDMRGFWKGLMTGDPHATTGVNPNDQKLHFSDYWKTPYHRSFSAESQWADPAKAPKWNEKDQLVMPDGKVVYDERKEQTERLQEQEKQNKSLLQDLKKFLNKQGMPTNLDELLSGNYPLGVAAVGKLLGELSKQKGDK